MYEPRMTKEQAIQAARFLIVDFHDNAPVTDTATDAVMFSQFARELAAAVQTDINPDTLADMLETLDRGLSLYFRIDEYLGISTTDYLLETEHISNVFTSDLQAMFSDYEPRAAFYFQTHKAA